MIKFLNIQMYVYVRTNDKQSASARYIIIRERFRCILFALNVEKTTAIHLE